MGELQGWRRSLPTIGPVRPARDLWAIYEPFHVVTYFAPEARAAFEAVGYRGFWRGYFAGRSAPLGRTPAAVVTALFGGFAPRTVERALPAVWELAPPEVALEARLDGARDALGRILAGRDAEVEEAAALLRSVAERAATGGRALGAANAVLPWPDDALGVLWQAATTLREVRGDGHLAAQLAVGLDGLSTMVLRTGIDLAREVLQESRGWTEEEWEAARAGLVSRGLMSPDGTATISGRARLERAEELTDDLAHEPWEAAGDHVADRFREVAGPLSDLVRPELPTVTPIGLPTR